MNETAKNLVNDYANETEIAFLNSLTGHHAPNVKIQHDQIIADFYLAKLRERMVDRQIETNQESVKKQITSAKKSSTALNLLTGALVFVGLIEIAAMVVLYLMQQSAGG